MGLEGKVYKIMVGWGDMARILVVENERDYWQVLACLLQEGGHRPSFAEDDCRGLIKLRERSFDVALVDMGVSTGFSNRAINYANDETQTVPIIMSGHGQQIVRTHFSEKDFPYFFYKHREEELNQIIEDALFSR